MYGNKSLESSIKEKFTKDLKITFTKDGIYGIIDKDKAFKEYLGEYYQKEENLDVPEVNKIKKRVITYIKN